MNRYCYNEKGGIDASDDLAELVLLKFDPDDDGDGAVLDVAEKAYEFGRRNVRYIQIACGRAVLWMEGRSTEDVFKSVTKILDKYGITAE